LSHVSRRDRHSFPTRRSSDLGDIDRDRDSNDSKVACSELKIGREVGLKELIEAGVNFILEKVDWKNAKESNTGDRSVATNTEDRDRKSTRLNSSHVKISYAVF